MNTDALAKGCAAFVEREMRWHRSTRRGRWIVIKPGPGRLLKDLPQHIRDYVDAITPKRGRRFSSLSRARAFAREVGGEVRRWHRELTIRFQGRKMRGDWRLETNPWKTNPWKRTNSDFVALSFLPL